MTAPTDPELERIFATGDAADFRARLRAADARELTSLWIRAHKRGYEGFRDAADAEIRRRGSDEAKGGRRGT